LAAGLIVILVHTAFGATVATAADKRMIVGTWYGETTVPGQYGEKSYNFRRWLRVNYANGTGKTFMRFYTGPNLQVETTEMFKWGVDNEVYWEECNSVKEDAAPRPCSGRTEYRIQMLTSRELLSDSQRTGLAYREMKVPADFKLP
jgi:hypothetical protein